jgi:transglutaminase-like putative cysteine protease
MAVISPLLGALILTCFFGGPANGQDPVAAAIPDSLQKDADVVERMDATEIDIESSHKAKIHYRYVYTILNAAGDEYATIRTYYDKFHELVNATAILSDAGGKVLKKVRKGEMEDWSTAGSGILMTDARVKLYHFSCRSYPYSVSFEEEIEQTGLFVLPAWRPQPSPGMAVESSSLVVRIPAGYPLRYKQYGYPPLVRVEQQGQVYHWEMHNKPAKREEPLAPSWNRTETSVLLASGDFEEGGYKGSLYSWADLGKFVNNLYRGRDRLPDDARQKVHGLVDGLKDDKEKIDVLYDFLQRDTHYVGIELGIGGWQPFDAAEVYQKKYGDCKALSNYMVALLKEAGIRACNVLIRAGQAAPAIDTGFVCSQFNHAIVVAFAGNDSVWLECTSPYLAPGYLSSFTADRDALLLDGNGGHIVHTPVYGVKENRFIRTVRGSIDSSGNLHADLQSYYSGLEQDALQLQLDRLSKKELTEQRQQSLGISNCTVSGLNDRMTRAEVPAIEETMQLEAEQFSTVSGNRLFLTPGVFLKRSEGIKEGQSRTSSLELALSYQETDSILLQIPKGYVPEGTLPSASYSSTFGSYRIHGEMSGDTLVLVCRYRQNKGVYPVDSWPKLVHFFNLIRREGNKELVFIKQSIKHESN